MNQRLQSVQNKLPNWGVDALLVEDKIDLYYLTGLFFSAGRLLIDPKEAHLIVDGRYEEMARTQSGLPVVLESEEALKELLAPFTSIGFDGASVPWERVQELMGQFKKLHWKSLPSPLKTLRAIKEPEELEKMRKAAELGSLGFDFVKTLLKEGIKEKEIARKLELFWKERGGKGFAFDPIIAFGENSALPHYHTGDRALKRGDPVLIDIGVIFEEYHSDMTRTLFFGEPSAQMKEIYLIVEAAQKKAFDKAAVGITCGEVDKAAREHIEEKGYAKAFVHGLGHGVGLEIHEWPYLKNKAPYADIPLVEGMCVTLEPGIYLPKIGGVRIEDTVHIGSSGPESLTRRPTELREAIFNA